MSAPYPPEILSILKSGGVVIFPTDTVYGLGCDPNSHRGAEKIFNIKGRKLDKPLQLLISDFDMMKKWISIFPGYLEPLLNSFWPGSLTVILSSNITLHKYIQGEDGSLGFRMPDSESLRKMIRYFGKPLAATSANISGGKSPVRFNEIQVEILDKVDFVWEDDSIIKSKGSSTVLDCRSKEGPQVLRRGPDFSKIEIWLEKELKNYL